MQALSADVAMRTFVAAGFGPFVGVPCSSIASLITWCEREAPGLYRTANNEGEAVAIAAGLALAGRSPVVVLQNSGLGNAVNPLSSLCDTMRIPLLLLVTWRGQPGRRDEPQHLLMGRITRPLLDLLEIHCESIEVDERRFEAQVGRLAACLAERNAPCALVVPDGSLTPAAPTQAGTSAHPRRREAIAAIVRGLDDDVVVVSTTGKTSRELASDWDRAANLYVVGSMGCAASVGLGIAMGAPDRKVIVLDGDGAALMRLEAMVSIGAWRPRHFVHVLLDNCAYESTGGQRTNASAVDFTGLAAACAYATARTIHDLDVAADAVQAGLVADGPHLVRVPIAVGSDPDLGRPVRSPVDVAAGLHSILAGRPGDLGEPDGPA